MFRCHTRDNTQTASHYIAGLLQADKANMERMQERVCGADYQGLQQFISDSPWSARDVMDRVASEVDHLLGGLPDSALLIDESGFVKKGTKSAGVARQWLGRLGKKDNGQVGVFAALAAGDRAALVDGRLFLPEVWANDPQRCAEAGIPEGDRVHRSKVEMALEMVAHQRRLGTHFGWVLADGLYGNSGIFTRGLEEQGETFLVDVHCNRLVYTQDPAPTVPPPKPGRGRKPQHPKATSGAVRVDHLAAAAAEADWHTVKLRQTTKGPLLVAVLHRDIFLWDGDPAQPVQPLRLLVRRDANGDHHYCVSNAPASVSDVELARVQAQRQWIERAFEDAKSEAGMAEYQVRKWQAWHHHMALVMMTMLFMLRYRLTHREAAPLLSCRDIRLMLEALLPTKGATFSDQCEQLHQRHRRRQTAIDWHNRQNQLADST